MKLVISVLIAIIVWGVAQAGPPHLKDQQTG